MPGQGTSDPSKASLLKAWETIQKNDPQVIIFAMEGENLYRFKTEHFPFDGQLKVLNITVDDRLADTDFGQTMGVIEVELVDADQDFLSKHAYSYSIWARNNMLYFDQAQGRWLNSKEYFAEAQKRWKKKGWNPFSNLWLEWPFLVIFGILAFLFFAVTRMQRKNERFMQNSHDLARETLELARDSNRILKEILENLKK
jgi:hypothetical protein